MKSAPPPEKIQHVNRFASKRGEQLQHGLVHRRRVGPTEARMASGRDPGTDHCVELVGSDRTVRELHELEHRRDASGSQVVRSRRLAELSGTIHREGELRVRILRRQCAVVVEDGDPLKLGHERDRVRIRDSFDKVQDGLSGGRLTPTPQWVRHSFPGVPSCLVGELPEIPLRTMDGLASRRRAGTILIE